MLPKSSRNGLIMLVPLLSLVFLMPIFYLKSFSAQISTSFTVNTSGDTPDVNLGDGICADGSGNCSIRAAVQEFVYIPGENYVILPSGSYVLYFLPITETLTINGAGSSSTIIDSTTGQYFVITNVTPSAEMTVTISGVTLQDGVISGDGGAIDNSENLALKDCVIQNNHATRGGGIFVRAGGSLIVDNCVFSGNVAAEGGAIYSAGTLTVTNSTFYNNAGEGGAIRNLGSMSISNTTFSGNVAGDFGAGIYSVSAFPSKISHSTITNNAADANVNGIGDGGGIYSDGSLLIQNVILANNIDYGGEAPDCGGGLVSNGYNLIKDLSGCTVTLLPSDLFGLDPLLGPLANNGGTTLTHALLPGSPAIDTGSCTDPDGNPVPFDQRGMPRPQGITCDMGAYEFGFRVWLPFIMR